MSVQIWRFAEVVDGTDVAATTAKRREQRPSTRRACAMRVPDAVQWSNAVVEDSADEDLVTREEKGHALAATLILDEFATPVPDRLTIDSLARKRGKLTREGVAADLSARADSGIR